MNLRQLRCFCQVVDSGYNITAAAQALHATQPGLSKQIAALERELGVEILLRRGNRIVGCTVPGEAILKIARRMLSDAQAVRAVGEAATQQDSGRLVVATTHTHARYVLPDVVQQFTERYPRVQLVLRQSHAHGVAELVAAGEADLGISASSDRAAADLIVFPCYKLSRALVAPVNHPVLSASPLTLHEIARYPLIALDTIFDAGRRVLKTFASAGLSPTVVMRATDTGVIKWYVRRGLGIAVLPAIAYDPERDWGIRAIPVENLFEGQVACLMLRRNHYLLRYMRDFAHAVAPQWSAEAIDLALETGKVPPQPVEVRTSSLLGAASRPP